MEQLRYGAPSILNTQGQWSFIRLSIRAQNFRTDHRRRGSKQAHSLPAMGAGLCQGPCPSRRAHT